MTCSLVVNSKSGNTRMVSGAIKRALQAAGVEFVHAAALSDDADADQVALEAQGACAADTVLVGFWCDKGACTPSVATLLSALARQACLPVWHLRFWRRPELLPADY